jgi:uncharacterized protein (DUF302 family)
MHRILLAIAAMLITISAATAGTVKSRAGWVVIDTSQSYSALVTRLEAAVKAEKMGLVTSASASEGAKGAGIVIPGNRVVGVFRNDFARRMLSASVQAGIEAPIRYYITENIDGGTTLSYKKPSFVFAPYFNESKDDLKVIARELDEIFKKIADFATKEK